MNIAPTLWRGEADRSSILSIDALKRWVPGLRCLGDFGRRHRLFFVVRVVLVSLASVLWWCAGVAGCSRPESATAMPPAKPAAPPLVPPQASEERSLDGELAVEPAAADVRVAEAAEEFTLSFVARANPFAPAKAVEADRLNASKNIQPADVKLLGLMRDGSRSMAVVDIEGKQSIVLAGTNLESSTGGEGIRIVEIRDADIVVAQSGRQWIVPLPRP